MLIQRYNTNPLLGNPLGPASQQEQQQQQQPQSPPSPPSPSPPSPTQTQSSDTKPKGVYNLEVGISPKFPHDYLVLQTLPLLPALPLPLLLPLPLPHYVKCMTTSC